MKETRRRLVKRRKITHESEDDFEAPILEDEDEVNEGIITPFTIRTPIDKKKKTLLYQMSQTMKQLPLTSAKSHLIRESPKARPIRPELLWKKSVRIYLHITAQGKISKDMLESSLKHVAMIKVPQ